MAARTPTRMYGACRYVCMYVYTYVRTHICMYAHAYLYTWQQGLLLVCMVHACLGRLPHQWYRYCDLYRPEGIKMAQYTAGLRLSRSVCMYWCVCVCVLLCVFLCVVMYMNTRQACESQGVYVCVCVCMCMHICVHMCVYVCTRCANTPAHVGT